jgi:hypothetical protein
MNAGAVGAELGRRLLPQCHVQALQLTALSVSCRGQDGALQIHRRMAQSPLTALRRRVLVANRFRKERTTPASPAGPNLPWDAQCALVVDHWEEPPGDSRSRQPGGVR